MGSYQSKKGGSQIELWSETPNYVKYLDVGQYELWQAQRSDNYEFAKNKLRYKRYTFLMNFEKF